MDQATDEELRFKPTKMNGFKPLVMFKVELVGILGTVCIQTSIKLNMPFPDPNTQILTFKNCVYQSDTSLVINGVNVKGG